MDGALDRHPPPRLSFPRFQFEVAPTPLDFADRAAKISALDRARIEGTSVLTGMNHITLCVRDLARSIEFYQDLLELRLAAV